MIRYIFPYFSIALYSLFLLLCMEWIYRGSPGLVKNWMRTEYHEFVLVYIFITSLFLLLYGFKRKLFISLTVFFSIILIVLSIVNRTKMTLRGDPLIPADLALASEARNMLTFFSDTPIWQLVLICITILVVLGGIVFIISKLPRDSHWNWHRVITAVLAASTLFYIYNEEVEEKYSSIRAKYGIKTIDYNQKQNYELNGFLMAFIRNIKWLSIEPPANYSKNTIEQISSKYKDEPYAVTEEKPHIIMIMSEAFWDPTLLNNVKYSQDPLANFHKLAESNTSGSLLVPVFGGSTANTEFESITGYSMNYLPAGSIPYQFHVKKPIQSLPQILKKQGYSTTAFHSFHNWFYQRNVVYKNIGFDNFVSLEFIPEPVKDYMYFRDREVNDLIIKHVKNSKEPSFILDVTMQNHGPFKADIKKSYAAVEANHTDGQFSKEAKNILEFFADNMVQVDQELMRLISELDQLNEKVMVVYYGDHLPLLGLNYQVYKEAGYFSNEREFEDYKKIYSTPLLVWDNFSNIDEDINLSASFLPAYVLRRAGLEGTSLTNMLNTAIEKGNTLFPRQDFMKNVHFDDTLYSEYQALQYDALFGKRFAEDSKAPANKDFRLGFHDPVISDVQVKDQDQQELIIVKGKHFTKASSIFLDGEKVETTFDNGTLKANVSEINNDSVVEVKILDSYERVLSTSKEEQVF
jgi:phosphoglycerol transferase MdoB-like AlkP superfamily enzyme